MIVDCYCLSVPNDTRYWYLLRFEKRKRQMSISPPHFLWSSDVCVEKWLYLRRLKYCRWLSNCQSSNIYFMLEKERSCIEVTVAYIEHRKAYNVNRLMYYKLFNVYDCDLTIYELLYLSTFFLGYFLQF